MICSRPQSCFGVESGHDLKACVPSILPNTWATCHSYLSSSQSFILGNFCVYSVLRTAKLVSARKELRQLLSGLAETEHQLLFLEKVYVGGS